MADGKVFGINWGQKSILMGQPADLGLPLKVTTTACVCVCVCVYVCDNVDIDMTE